MGASMAISAQGSPTAPQAARLVGITGRSKAPNASPVLPALRRVAGNHETPTALHCADPRADGVSQRAMDHGEREQPLYSCRRKPQHAQSLSFHRLLDCLRLCIVKAAGAGATKQAAAALNAPITKDQNVTRLLLCTATILALTAQANAQREPCSYFGPGSISCEPSWSAGRGNPCTPPKPIQAQRTKQEIKKK